MLAETNLAAEAHAELSQQIEDMAPSAAILTTRGFGWQTAAALVSALQSGKPDIDELRANGIDLKTAVAICEAIAARHARRAAAIAAMKPRVVPAPALPAPLPTTPVELDRMTAFSMMHTLAEETEGPRYACMTTLIRDGWSEPTAREITRVANAALAAQRTVRKHQ